MIPKDSSLALLLGLGAGCLSISACRSGPPRPTTDALASVELSEDPAEDAALRATLAGFLDSLADAASPEHGVEQTEHVRHAFFFESLTRGARGTTPLVLEVRPAGGGRHIATLAFLAEQESPPRITRVIELEARPSPSGFTLGTAYDRRAAELQQTRIDEVLFRSESPLDLERARRFVRTKRELEALHGRPPAPLVYDCFDSLDSLLGTYGLLHDASKCNLLLHDLGFLWDDGAHYTTGTGDAAYLFGYVRGVLRAWSDAPDEIYSPYLNGVAAFLGGYGLSGDSVETLAAQFRAERERRPDIDFLEEFRKGRKASVNRHFSHYVMCALLCAEIVERHGLEGALRPLTSGPEGERFFAELEALLGVTEDSFHEAIVEAIESRA